MMSIEESKKRKRKSDIILICFFSLTIAGITLAVSFYRKLAQSEARNVRLSIELEKKTAELYSSDSACTVFKKSCDARLAHTDSLILISKNNGEKLISDSIISDISRDKREASKNDSLGYEELKRSDYQKAMTFFYKSENSYNGYRHSYEIWRLLFSNRQKFDIKDTMDNIVRTIEKNYPARTSKP